MKPVAFQASKIPEYLAHNTLVNMGCVIRQIADKTITVTVSDSDDTYRIACQCPYYIDVEEDVHVMLIGQFMISNDLTQGVYFSVSEHRTPDNASNIKLYRKLKVTLENPKYSKILSELKSKSPPRSIYNVGLIVSDSVSDSGSKFMAQYRENCMGTINIFRYSEEPGKDICSAILYFTKYHNIDAIVVLCDDMHTSDIWHLSSTKCIKLLLNTTQCPYIISVLTSGNQYTYCPLICDVSNKTITGIYNAVSFIHHSQNSVRKTVDSQLRTLKSALATKIADYRNRLANYRITMDITDRVDKNVYYRTLLRQLKYRLLATTTQYRLMVANKDRMATNLLLNNEYINSLFDGMIKKEEEIGNKKVSEKIEISKDN